MKDTQLSRIWKERMVSWEESGKSISQWCEEYELPAHQFYYWKDRLNGKKRNRSSLSTENKFIQLQDDHQSQSGVMVEIAGAQLHVSPGFDEETFVRCLHVLRRNG